MRFLPAPGTEVPMVKVFGHNFKGRGGSKYVEECPTTIGKSCPVCDSNSEAWNSGNKDLARKRSRNKSGITNVYIINDPPSTRQQRQDFFSIGSAKTVMEKVMEAE